MPDESTNPVWTTQGSQNNQSVSSQSWNDFVLDFWDLWDNNVSTSEEVQVDSLAEEEEKTDDLGFDIDLWWDNQDTIENVEEWVNESWDNNIEIPVWEEEVRDFDISMDYEWSNWEVTPDEEIKLDEEVTSDEEIKSDEGLNINFAEDKNSEPENPDIETQPSEKHLFQQIDWVEENDSQLNTNEVSETFQSSEDRVNNQLFMGEWVNNETSTDADEKFSWEATLDWPKEFNKMEWVASLIEEAPEQRQPEITDLLSKSPIDLSEELNDKPETSDLWDMDVLSDDANKETQEESISSPESEEIQLEPVQQNIENDLKWESNNQPLSDISLDHTEEQNMENSQQEGVLENKLEDASQEAPQDDERSEVINNAVTQINEQISPVSEINISAPVELSNMSSNQKEANSVESWGQVQSTLSLDQILDSELLSNPQYADNSTASPQNQPASEWHKSKMWLFVGAGVAILACCVIFLAFPSINWDRKSGDVVTNTWSAVEYTGWNENPNPSVVPDSPDEPIWVSDIHPSAPASPENPIVPGDQWSAQVFNFPDWDGDWGDTQPIPYIWLDSWENDKPDIQEPQIEEVDANQILDVIWSFKSQAEWYYSYAEETSDKQLMKYAQNLINRCDNYEEQVKKGEWVDTETLASFKSAVNKLINKIVTYLGWDEEAAVVVEATIGSESNFPWKDEIIDYLKENR